MKKYSIQLFNTLTQRKETFIPINPEQVNMYVCGVTVYDLCHIGHARVYISFDILYRLLKACDYEVNYVCNITDIDDKIIRRANENKESMEALTQRYTIALHQDMGDLNVLPPTSEPKATESIDAMIQMIQTLIEKDYAYVADHGDVCFKVKQFADYGKLAQQDIQQLRAGERVTAVESKQDPLDFVLWKKAKLGEPSWESPWGAGRPGWHIECSAMSTTAFGNQTFDIHGGGLDLKFPHHQNEIAQTEPVTGCRCANYWVHNGFVTVDDEKMSKSLGNFFTIREVLKHYSAEVIRYFIISSHYRSGINYSQENLENAKQALTRFYTALRGLEIHELNAEELTVHGDYEGRFMTVLCDDMNTPEALAVLFELAREVNQQKQVDIAKATQLGSVLYTLAQRIGLLSQPVESFFKADSAMLDESVIEAEIVKRNRARQDKNWQLADEIRDQLAKQGVVLEDKGGETIWRVG